MPKGMRVMAERLGAFTRNRFRIENAGSNSCLPGQIITVTLPSNTLVDLHSLRMHARFQALGGGMGASSSSMSNGFLDSDVDNFALKPVAPDDFHQLVSRMSVSANGTAIQQGCMEYNTVTAIKNLMDGTHPQNISTKSYITPNERPEPATNASMLRYYPTINHTKGKVTGIYEDMYPKPGDSGTSTLGMSDFFAPGASNPKQFLPFSNTYWNNYNSENEALANLSDGEKGVGLQCTDFQLHNWRGYLGESSVRYLPTDLVGAIQIQLTMADANVLPVFGRGPGGALVLGDHKALFGTTDEKGTPNLSEVKPFSYRLSNIYWTIDTLSVDGPYGDMLRGKIAEKGYISLLFKEYYVFNKSGCTGDSTEQHRFSLATGSMDKIYSVIRRNDYNSKNHHVNSNFEMVASKDPNWYTPMTQFVMPTLQFHNYGWNYIQTADSSNLGTTITKDGYVEPAITNGGGPTFSNNIAWAPRPSHHYDVESGLKYDYKINSVMHPQFEAGAREAMYDTAYSHDMQTKPHGIGNNIFSRAEWFEQKAIVPLTLNLTDGPLQLMSGYDSRGHSSFVEYSVRGLQRENYKKVVGGANATDYSSSQVVDKYDSFAITSVVETTSELRIGAGLSLVIAR